MQRADERLVRRIGRRPTLELEFPASSRWDRQHPWLRASWRGRRGYGRVHQVTPSVVEFVPDDGEEVRVPVAEVRIAPSQTRAAVAARRKARAARRAAQRREARRGGAAL